MANVSETTRPSGQGYGGQHYSGTNRIPNIKQFVDRLDRDKKARDAQLDAQAATADGAVADGEHGEHGWRGGRGGRNHRVVTDPVTGREVEIADMDDAVLEALREPVLCVPNANLGRPTTVQTEATHADEAYRHRQDVTAPPAPLAAGATSDVPIRGEKTNVLFHPTPAVSYEPMFAAVERRAHVLGAALFGGLVVAGHVLLGEGGGGIARLAALAGVVAAAAAAAAAVVLWARDLVRRGRALEWTSERRRGETALVNLIPESVEWLNAALARVWALVRPDTFAAVADALEDVMQASVPGVVDNVKVNDLSQGSNPLRVVSLRALPDREVEDLMGTGGGEEDDDKNDKNDKGRNVHSRPAQEAAAAFYNLEATVAYHSLPSGRDVASKARNMGMQLVFYLGIRGLFGVPFPVWVELNGLVCTVRLRVAMTPDPPFVKTVSFTLMGLPKIEASCVPLMQRGANVLNLPLISRFVNWAIAAAADAYVAPKSMTLDVGTLLRGDGIQRDTGALGVLIVRIDKAVGLSKQDARGSPGGGSDPYICVAFSKFGKPQYCTRVVQDDLNPFFAETAALLVTRDVVSADELLSLELWDSDRTSADDLVGKVELSIQKLLRHPGRMFPQVSGLRGVHAESSMPGELHWAVGYFEKTPFRRELRTGGAADGEEKHVEDGEDGEVGEDGEDDQDKHVEDKHDDADAADAAAAAAATPDDAVLHTPPDPLWPSGILSIVVHQVVGLELANVRGSRGGRRKGHEYEPARPEAGELKEEQAKTLPSAYCTIIVNDELVYKTRTKMVSSRPIFEAGTERFVRDWRSAIATVTVRDARNRQHDPIIGVVPLKLSDVLRHASQSTRWYPLDAGIGYGRVRISLLFRSVELRLPPAHIGFGEVGTFEFLSDTITATAYDAPSPRVKLRLRTGGSSARVRAGQSRRAEGGMCWDIGGSGRGGGHDDDDDDDDDNNNNNDDDDDDDNDSDEHAARERVRLPVQYRYRSPVFFELRPVGHSRRKAAYASVWLQDLEDNKATDFDIPLWRCDNPLRLSQNYITEANCHSVPDLALEEVGRLTFCARFKPGTDRDHLRFVSDNDTRQTIETWEACFAEGVRGETVAAEVPEHVQKLHDAALRREQARDRARDRAWNRRRAAAASEEQDKRRWLAKDGTDWTGAFGEAPADGLDGEDDEDEVDYAYGDEDGDEDSDEDDDEDDEDVYDKDNDDDDDDPGNGRKKNDHRRHDSGVAVDLGIRDASTGADGNGGSPTANVSRKSTSSSLNPIKKYRDYKARSRDLHRRQRGLMQWKPMRNVQFAKDEATFAVRRVLNVGKLNGRTPDVETEV